MEENKEQKRLKTNEITLESGTSLAEYEHTNAPSSPSQPFSQAKTLQELTQLLHSDDIKTRTTFTSPFTLNNQPIELPIVYCDHTATSTTSSCIESYIQNAVLPFLGNTHTNTSITGSQSTAFLSEARQIIAEECGCHITGKASKHVILFTGSGTTSCVALIIDILNLLFVDKQDIVVFMSCMEHHSNMIPWREIGCRIVMVDTTKDYLTSLEEMLSNSKEKIKIGTFTAMSNVTGQALDTESISDVLHKYNALSIFDYATASSYLSISMNDKDILYFSPHKLLGGNNTPGVLIVKKSLIDNVYSVPSKSGGGTVFYVTKHHHRFLSNRIERYEGGTPDIIGIIRVGLVFLLRRDIIRQYESIPNQVPTSIEEYDYLTYQKVVARLSSCPNLHILGKGSAPIFSFLIQFQHRFLHYNLVCALLNDIFGIQSRGGCQCSGPYSQILLGLSDKSNNLIEQALLTKAELLRPGYTRISLPFKSSVDVEYVCRAIEWVCRYGWCMSMVYRCDYRTGEWRHTSRQGRPFGKNMRKWLSHFVPFTDTKVEYNLPSLEDTYKQAYTILEQTLNNQYQWNDARDVLDPKFEPLRWFVYPHECYQFLNNAYTYDMSVGEVIGPIQPNGGIEEDGGVVVDHAKKLCRDKNNWGVRIGPDLTTAKVPIEHTVTSKKHKEPKIQTKKSEDLKFQTQFSRQGKQKFKTPPPKLSRQIIQAIIQYSMIQNNDRLLLGLSGGKDSLSLLHCLLFLQKKLPIKFDIEVCTIDPLTPSFDPSPLIPYIESLGLKYHYIKDDIIARASTSGSNSTTVKSLCAYCARMKRGNLYTTARKAQCNKLVLAQHLDDCAESLFMSMMHNGFLCTMKAKYTINDGDLEVIRPLIFVREKLLTEFAQKNNLPIINENCPACFEEPKERARIKKLLSREEMLFPTLFDNIRRSLVPLFHEDMTPVIRSYTEEIVKKSRKEDNPDCWGIKSDVKESQENENVKLHEASEEQLLRELAKRRADKYRLFGSMKKKDEKDEEDVILCTASSCT